MPMPKPGEDRKSYVARCVPVVMSEGTAKDNEQAAAICYSMWSKHHENMERDTATLRDVEIFKVGKWNGVKVDEAMLDDMVAAFEELNSVHRVPLKFGHRPDAGVPKGQPALGWVTALRRAGGSLLATFEHVPAVVKTAFEKKLYRTVSIEMLFGAKLGKRLFKHVLDAVALLGADQPAVHGLEDLDRFLAERSAVFDGTGRRLSFEAVAGSLNQQAEVIRMDQEIKDRFAALEALITKNFSNSEPDADTRKKLRAQEDEIEDLKRAAKKDAEARVEFAAKQKTEAVKTKRAAVLAIFETAVKARKLIPADREQMIELYNVNDDEAVLKVDEAKLTAKFDALKAQGKTGGAAHSVTTPTDERPDQAMVKLVNESMLKTGETDFRKEFERVARANPELHLEYLNMTRPEVA